MPDEKPCDYVIVEEVQKSWDKKDADKAGNQQILDMNDRILLCANNWKGTGKFVLKKKTDVSILSEQFTIFRTNNISISKYHWGMGDANMNMSKQSTTTLPDGVPVAGYISLLKVTQY